MLGERLHLTHKLQDGSCIQRPGNVGNYFHCASRFINLNKVYCFLKPIFQFTTSNYAFDASYRPINKAQFQTLAHIQFLRFACW